MTSLEKLISEARMLGTRLRDNENFADTLISQASSLQNRLESMKQYEEDLNKLNDIPKRKPRQKLIMEIAQESRQIRDLKNENLELKACLDEHQTALELIMTKYREQMRQFMMTKKLEDSILQVLQANNLSEARMKEKISEMSAVMKMAASMDDELADKEQEALAQLNIENRGLKELLRINRRFGVSLTNDKVTSDQYVQTLDETVPSHADLPVSDDETTPESSEIGDTSMDDNVSVIDRHTEE